MSITTLRLLIALLACLGPSSVYAHGGVAIEFDECVVRIGKFTMHFTAYQSGKRHRILLGIACARRGHPGFRFTRCRDADQADGGQGGRDER